MELSVQEFLGHWKSTKEGKAVLALAEERAKAERRDLIERRKGLIAEAARVNPPLGAAVRAAQDREAQARQAFERARDEVLERSREAFAVSFQFERKVNCVEFDLRATAPRCIREFIARTRERMAKLGGPALDVKEEPMGILAKRRWFSDAASVKEIRTACLEAIEQAETLQVTVLDEAEAQAAIEKLEARLAGMARCMEPTEYEPIRGVA